MKNNDKKMKLSVLSIMVTSALSAQLTYAQEISEQTKDPSSTGLMEVINVTAQKRVERVQDVPIAMNALSGDLLEALRVSDTDDIEGLYPNLSTNNTSSINSGFSIRGVGTNNFHISGQQSIGTNIDDVAAVTPFVSAIGVYDIERVEVLRGPQNTLYGRNTTGGVVNFHTRKASTSDVFNYKGAFTLGTGGTEEIEAAVGFNLSDSVAARVAVVSDKYDGEYNNIVDGSDVGAKEKKGARLNLQWDISENTNVNFTIATGDANGDGLTFNSLGNVSSDGETPCPAFVNGGESTVLGGRNNCWTAITNNMVNGTPYIAEQAVSGNTDFVRANPNSQNDPMNPWLINYSTENASDVYASPFGGYDAEFDGFRLKLSHTFENMDLNWLSAYDKTYVKNTNVNNLTGFSPTQEGEFNVWQHELRLSSSTDSSLRWMVGAYYSTQESEEDTWVFRGDGAVAGGNGVSPSIIIDSNYDAWSAYGQVDYDLTEKWSLTAGLRYTDDKLEGDTQKWVCIPGQHNGVTFDGVRDYDREYRFDNCNNITNTLIDKNPTQELSELGWKVGVNYKAEKDLLLYASVAEGFKGGAYDNRALDVGSSPIDPEFLTAYEMGAKSEWLDGLLQLNAALYYYEWKDLQVFGIDENGGPAQVNIPSTDLSGLEVDFKWQPTENLFLQGGVGFSSTEITDVTGTPIGMDIQKGNEITNSPSESANLLGVYIFTFSESELLLQLSYRYQGEAYFTMNAQDTSRAKSDSHDFINTRITYKFGEDLLHSVSFWGDNLTDERVCEYYPTALPGNVNWGCGMTSSGQTMWGLTFETKY
jgi:iron complex outermembrane receptor protein